MAKKRSGGFRGRKSKATKQATRGMRKEMFAAAGVSDW